MFFCLLIQKNHFESASTTCCYWHHHLFTVFINSTRPTIHPSVLPSLPSLRPSARPSIFLFVCKPVPPSVSLRSSLRLFTRSCSQWLPNISESWWFIHRLRAVSTLLEDPRGKNAVNEQAEWKPRAARSLLLLVFWRPRYSWLAASQLASVC